MIREQDLLDAIAECQGERNPNANTCIKMAAYYTILNQMYPNNYSYAKPPSEVTYNSGSEFSDIIIGRDLNEVISIIDELMETISVLAPKLYDVTIKKLRG